MIAAVVVIVVVFGLGMGPALIVWIAQGCPHVDD